MLHVAQAFSVEKSMSRINYSHFVLQVMAKFVIESPIAFEAGRGREDVNTGTRGCRLLLFMRQKGQIELNTSCYRMARKGERERERGRYIYTEKMRHTRQGGEGVS